MIRVVVFLSMLATAALPGWAALGGPAESVVADQVKFQATRSVVETQTYTVHDIRSGY